MKPGRRLFPAVLAATLGACAAPASNPASQDVFAVVPSHRARVAEPLCPARARGAFRCFAWARLSRAAIEGLTPPDLQSAYRFPSASHGRTSIVAIVGAYDDPKAESDLHVYRSRFHLPACTAANHCFRKVNERGEARAYPRPDRGWTGEMSLDLDMVSAVCPHCKLLLVEATSNSAPDLGLSVRTAARLGATVISNSYGGFEYAPYDANFDQRGKAIVVAGTGDDGYFPQQPASFATVVAVGGTSLQRSSNGRGWNERVWNDADIGATGSGCSDFVAKPAWQTDAGCPTRAEADVSAVADPLTGVAVYDSSPVGASPVGGWVTFGGTSVSTPIIAGAYGLAGNGRQLSSTFAKSIYDAATTPALNRITEGSNGSCPTVYAYICNAGTGYNGPTGWGTPNGIGAF